MRRFLRVLVPVVALAVGAPREASANATLARNLLKKLVNDFPHGLDGLLKNPLLDLLPGVSELRRALLQVVSSGANEFKNAARGCPDKLRGGFLDLPRPDGLRDTIRCFLDAVKKAMGAAGEAMVQQARQLLGNAIRAAQKGRQAIESALGPLGKLNLPLLSQIRDAVLGAAGSGGEAFAKQAASCPDRLKSLAPQHVMDVLGCLTSAAATAAKAGFGALLGPIKECLPKIDLAALLGPASLSKLTPGGILAAIGKNLDSGLAPLRCLARAILPQGLPGFPSLDQIGEALKMAGQKAVAFLQNPQAFLKSASDQVLEKVTRIVPKMLEWVMKLREDFRALLLLELKDTSAALNPFSPTEHDNQIRAFADRFLEPLLLTIDEIATELAPPSLARWAKDLLRKPLQALSLVIFRTFLLGRSGLMKLARVVVPGLVRGATHLAELVNRIPVPPLVRNLVLGAFDTVHELFGGLGATLLEALGLKDTVDQVLGGVLGAYDEAKGATGAMTALAGARTAEELFAAFEGSDKAQQANLPQLRTDHAAAAKAAAAASQAAAAAERALYEAELGKGGHPAVAAARKKLDEATAAATTAADKVREAGAALERADPNLAEQRVVGTIWDSVSDALVKGLWDTSSSVANLLSDSALKLTGIYIDVVVAVVGAVLSAIPFTTTYGPTISNVVGFVLSLVMNFVNVAKSVFFALVLPEFRMLVKDQLVSMKSIFLEMYRNPKERETLRRATKVFAAILEKLGPLADRLRRVHETVKLGASGLLAGPLGAIFKSLPKGLFAAISKAIQHGLELLRKTVVGAAVGAIQGATGKGGVKIDAKQIARSILREIKDPIIDFLANLVPDEDPDGPLLAEGLRAGLGTAADVALRQFETHPVSLLNPKAILGIIADGVLQPRAKEALARFLTRDLGIPKLDESVGRFIAETAPLLRDPAKALELLRGGIFGILRRVVFVAEPTLKAIVLAQLPDEPELKGAFTRSFDRAFQRVLEPGAFEAAAKGGLKTILARILELCHEPVAELVLRTFPDGDLKEAVRQAARALGKKAAQPGFFSHLARGGIPAVLSEVVGDAAVVRAVAQVLTSGLGDEKLTAEVAAGMRGFVKELQRGPELAKLLQVGLKGVVTQVGKPVGGYIVRRLTHGLKLPASLAREIGVLLQKAVDALAAAKAAAPELTDLPRHLVSRVRAFFVKLAEKVEATVRDGAAPALALAREITRALGGSLPLPRKIAAVREILERVAGTSAWPEVTAGEVTP